MHSESRRCGWCNEKNVRYVEYHDNEWGVPRWEDGYLFEMLVLESFQAGLSFECILNKRENFRRAFDDFDPYKICSYTSEKLEDLYHDSGIVRNKRKICAVVENAKIFCSIVEQYGSFYNYLIGFYGGGVIYETGCVTSTLSDAISSDLFRRGMRFVGSVIIYSYLQAIGIIYSHEEGCFLFKRET